MSAVLKGGLERRQIRLTGASKRRSDNGTQAATREIPVGQKKNLFPTTGGLKLAQVPRVSGHILCIFEDVQKPPGQGPEQPGLAWELTLQLAGYWTADLQLSFPT